MRKLLLGTTALAAAATLSANTVLADVSISGSRSLNTNQQAQALLLEMELLFITATMI